MIFSRLDAIHESDRHIDGQTDTSRQLEDTALYPVTILFVSLRIRPGSCGRRRTLACFSKCNDLSLAIILGFFAEYS